MHLVGCERPKYVFSKQRNEFVRVACGKCDTCRMQKSYDWINRIEFEDVQHKYCFMVTLTYDDDHLPALFFSDDMENLVFNRHPSECIPLISLLDIVYRNKDQKVIDKELGYLSGRLRHSLGLPILYKKDISDFCKRFNKYCFDHVTHEFENFRYFCCGEYGPSVYRPHYHLLVWTSHDSIARRFQEILSSTWTFGISDHSAVYSDAGRAYVSQYVNMSQHLPSFYQFRLLRPGHQESKQPPIGSYEVLDSQIRGIYYRNAIKRTVYNSKVSGFSDVPYPKSYQNRFYPKLQGYNYLLDSDRVVLYGLYSFLPKEKRTFSGFKDFIRETIEPVAESIAGYVKIIFSLYLNYLRDNSETYESFESALKRWYYISKRICMFAYLSGYTVKQLVFKIDDFYKKCDYDCLCQFYTFQESYAQVHKVADLVVMYPDFYRLAKHYLSSNEQRPFYIDAALAHFDLYDINDLPDYKETFDYVSMSSLSKTIYKDTHKRHAINAYLDNSLVLSDPSLYQIIKDYQK